MSRTRLDTAFDIAFTVLCPTGALLNLLELVLIFTRSSSLMRNYRLFLANITVTNLLLNVFIYIAKVKMVNVGSNLNIRYPILLLASGVCRTVLNRLYSTWFVRWGLELLPDDELDPNTRLLLPRWCYSVVSLSLRSVMSQRSGFQVRAEVSALVLEPQQVRRCAVAIARSRRHWIHWVPFILCCGKASCASDITRG